MKHLFVASAMAALSLGLAAAPIPDSAKQPTLYFPTKVGTECIYETDHKKVYRTVVTEVATKGEVTIVTKEMIGDDGESSPWERVAVSPKGLSLLSNGPFRHDPPLEWLRLSAKVGDSWKIDTFFAAEGQNEIRLVGTVKIVGVEKVETPAGAFEAIRVDGCGRGFGKWAEQWWYTPGIGPVKWVDNAGTVFVLKSFKQGK
jgi:hypothetical protein